MKALIVDDEDSIRAFIVAHLTIEGWEVAEAASGREALAQFAATEPDVMVLDHMLGDMLGTDVAQRVRDQGFDRPIILFSAFLTSELKSEVDDLRLTLISKPDSPALFRVMHAFTLA